jgi:hypothetical protein
MGKSATKTFVIVESAAAWRHAESLGRTDVDTVWATTSPFVLECLQAEGRTVVAIDGDVSQDEANQVGYVALAAADRLVHRLDSDCADWPSGLTPGRAMAADLCGMLVSLLYKAYLLDRFQAGLCEEAVLMSVGLPELSPVVSYRTLPHVFDTIYSTLCHRLGLEVVEFDAPRPQGGMENSDFLRPTWWTRAITIANAPLATILFRMWRRFANGRAFRLRPSRAKLQVAVLKGSELVEEIFRSLLLRGASLRQIESYALPADEALSCGQRGSAPSVKATIAACREAAREHDLDWSRGLDAAAEIAGDRIHAALGYGRRAATGVADYCAGVKEVANGGPFAIITNAMSRPIERLFQQGLSAALIPVYVVDHGTGPGLDKLHQAWHDRGFAPPADAAIAYNECQLQAESRGRSVTEKSSFVSGAPTAVRKIGLRRLQRRVMRRRLRAEKRLVVWVTGLYPNNMIRLPHYFRDTPYHQLRKHILYKVLGGLDDTVMMKLYPTYRYADPDPFGGFMRLPDNCRYEQFIDFRNFRAGADVILIDSPGSGLAWCWSVGVPIIYIETGMMTLLPEIAEQFQEALFYVDAREPGWDAKLRDLLELRHESLVAQYRAKAEARERVSEFCILGPSGAPGKRAAAFVAEDATRRWLEQAASERAAAGAGR